VTGLAQISARLAIHEPLNTTPLSCTIATGGHLCGRRSIVPHVHQPACPPSCNLAALPWLSRPWFAYRSAVRHRQHLATQPEMMEQFDLDDWDTARLTELPTAEAGHLTWPMPVSTGSRRVLFGRDTAPTTPLHPESTVSRKSALLGTFLCARAQVRHEECGPGSAGHGQAPPASHPELGRRIPRPWSVGSGS
jgi:hypothetical protein